MNALRSSQRTIRSRGKSTAPRHVTCEPKAAGAAQQDPWRAEIQSLMGRKFCSLDEALEAVADAVLDRVGSTKADRGEEKKFLLQLLATDRIICEALEASVK